jgi:hypothetical protein
MEGNEQLHTSADLLSGKQLPVPHWIQGLVGPTAGINMVAKRNRWCQDKGMEVQKLQLKYDRYFRAYIS